MNLGPEHKGFPPQAGSLPVAAVGAQGWNVLRGDLALPLAVLKDSALAHNLRWMRDFCEARGLRLAPHGKTTMSPELWTRQLTEGGAWAISLATVWQASVAVRHGVPRVLIANQVVQWAELDHLAALHAAHPGLQSWFLVDSTAQVEAIERWAAARSHASTFAVLLEVGLVGHRTGVRTADEALAVAERVARSPVLALAGVECYEGVLASGDHARDRAGVSEWMDRVEALARAMVLHDWLRAEALIISAGGSSIFDLVAERMTPDLGVPVWGVLRSGCYVTHDHGRYRHFLCCVGERLHLRETLRPALEVWACVQSVPEPGLALLGIGRRDVGEDMGLPVPLWRDRVAAAVGSPVQSADGVTPQAVPSHWCITGLNDQHAYLKFDASAPVADHPRVGELVGNGISHPCTTFDKWRWMPVVDDAYGVIGAITTRF